MRAEDPITEISKSELLLVEVCTPACLHEHRRVRDLAHQIVGCEHATDHPRCDLQMQCWSGAGVFCFSAVRHQNTAVSSNSTC